MAIRVQPAPFDPGAELNAMHAANVGVGAVVQGYDHQCGSIVALRHVR